MNGKSFVDTNVLVYSRDLSEPEKQPVAQELLGRLWAARTGRTAMQVLNEYYVTVTRKLSPGMSRQAAWADVEALFAWNPVPLTRKLVVMGRDLESRYSLSWWDSLVVAAALCADCETLLTEDMQHGQLFGDLRVVNPFLG